MEQVPKARFGRKQLSPTYGNSIKEHGRLRTTNYTKRKRTRHKQSAQNEKIQLTYQLQIEIWNRDKPIFNTDLYTMLHSRSNKKRRFLERAKYLIAPSRKMAAMGQQTITQHFSHASSSRLEEPSRIPPTTPRVIMRQTAFTIQACNPQDPPAVSRKPAQNLVDDTHFISPTPTKGSDHHGAQQIQSCH